MAAAVSSPVTPRHLPKSPSSPNALTSEASTPSKDGDDSRATPGSTTSAKTSEGDAFSDRKSSTSSVGGLAGLGIVNQPAAVDDVPTTRANEGTRRRSSTASISFRAPVPKLPQGAMKPPQQGSLVRSHSPPHER